MLLPLRLNDGAGSGSVINTFFNRVQSQWACLIFWSIRSWRARLCYAEKKMNHYVIHPHCEKIWVQTGRAAETIKMKNRGVNKWNSVMSFPSLPHLPVIYEAPVCTLWSQCDLPLCDCSAELSHWHIFSCSLGFLSRTYVSDCQQPSVYTGSPLGLPDP